MSNILSQDEIEALLNSLGDSPEKSGVAEPTKSTAKSREANKPSWLKSGERKPARTDIPFEVYDFRRPDKFSRDQLRTLQMLHETFARLAGSSLSAYLRTPVTVELISLEQVPYEEYMRSIGGSVFTIISMPPLTGQAVIEIEFGLTFSIIDRLLGGPGQSISRTSLSDIERPLVRSTLEQMFGSLKSAWEGVVILSPGIEGMETSAQFVQIAPPSDIVITMLFEVKVGEQRGAMSICVPYLTLKPITPKLSAQRWFVSSNKKQGTGVRRNISHQVRHAEVPCTIELGKAHISTQEFLKMAVGDVVRLETRSDDDIQMLIGPTPKFCGRIGLSGRKMGFTITDTVKGN
ncbi:MAG: flagellar motor switch protein FliM [Fimbriimonadaceae bacterium]